MKDIYNIYVEKGVKFVLISREQAKEEIETFWAENSLTMPYSSQSSREVYSLFAQSRIPRIYISDRNGTIKTIFTDDPLPSIIDIETALNSIIE